MKYSLFLTAMVAILYLAAWDSGCKIALNPSVSMPRGIYFLMPTGNISRGSIVAVCIPDKAIAAFYVERGYLPSSQRCPSGSAPVFKPIAGMPSDTMKFDDSGVAINNHRISASKALDLDSKDRPLPHFPFGVFSLAENQFFVLSTHSTRSLDSRYFGLIQKSDVIGRVKPLITE